jgi:nucleolar protein 53
VGCCRGRDALYSLSADTPNSIPPKDLELVLPSELSESLRRLKPEGNLLKERFRSVRVRGKVETRAPISQPKRARRTTTERWSYKDWKLRP